ncbi:AvrD family protein [Curtobacterium luteum]|uniref:AvrD family protein n=1 Tax=Curtobacterium luteum TaxID=33881 RepID=UPI00380A254F
MTPDTIERHESIDDLLGPAAGRFFGLGYRLTDPRLRNAETHLSDGVWELTATADAVSGAAWSRKGDDEQEPHLSTTDLIVLAVASAYEILARERDAAALTTCAVARVDIRSPRSPIEGDLRALPVRGYAPAGFGRGADVSVAVDIAGFVITVDVLQDPSALPVPGGARVEDRPGDGVYCGVYRSRSPLVEDIHLTGDEASATVTVPELGRRPAAELCGLEAAFQPTMNIVDAFVAVLQLGQVLLYRLDAIDRAASDTLWMRRTIITVPAERRPSVRSSTRTRLERARTLQQDGRAWRLADIVGEFESGIEINCSIAHVVGAE